MLLLVAVQPAIPYPVLARFDPIVLAYCIFLTVR